MRLTATKVKALKDPGRYGDGTVPGLYFVIRPGGSKSWVQRIVIDGTRRDMGLGGYPDVSLARAREKAAGNRTALADGRDPRAQKRRTTPTFREATYAVLEMNRPRWRSPKHASNWIQMMERHAVPKLGSMAIHRIDHADVLNVLEPIWTSRPETARRIRQRLRSIFAWSMAHGHRTDNPAGEVIDAALPAQPAVKAHFRALPYQEVAAALDAVDASGASLSSRLCFRFLVLTAARSGEARGATWDEVDFASSTWTISGSRMKAGVEHRVPLSDQALDVLREARRLKDDSGLIFPSALRPGRPLSDMTMTKILRDLGLADRATVHGFRTSFKTWCMETTDTPWAVGEAALAHSLGNSTEQAYARSDLFIKRRALMQQWADYLGPG